jgi:transposase
MALPKHIVIIETEKEIKHLLKSSTPFIGQRLRVLLILKQHEATGISKREAARISGVCPDSIQKWRTLYMSCGIEGLMKHNKIGYKPSVFTLEEHVKIEEKLNNPENGLNGYVELNEWIRKEMGKTVLYRTVVNYCVKNFHSSVKVARKSHVKKDLSKVTDFKKTLVKSAKKFGVGKEGNTSL